MSVQQLNSFRTGPDEGGHFGLYGGRFVAETLMPLVLELEAAYAEAKNDPRFRRQMDGYLKDAMNEALRDWVTNVANTFYCIGTVAGPHPYPMMVRDFQSVIGNETRAQMLEAEGRSPDSLIACIGGGSNAMGLFHPFLDEP